MQKIKNFVVGVAGKMLSAAKSLSDVGFILILLSAATLLSAKAPELHTAWIRTHVGSKVYKIQDKVPGGGGTGFAVRAPSGIDYIVTNEHVCGVSQDDTVLVIDHEGNAMARRILERSDETDLCLIEGMPGVEGLTVSDAPVIGDMINIVGHPRLRPLSVSYGEVVGSTDVKILDYVMRSGNDELDIALGAKDGACDKPKNEILEYPVRSFFGEVIGVAKLCVVVTKDATMTTAVIFPGNSGSPVVDFWGNVVGVAFASDETGWGYLVSRRDLKHFLAHY